MARRIARLTVDTLADLPESVRCSVFWELDPVRRSRVESSGAEQSEKEAWVSGTLLEWGSCGRVLYVDDQPAGFVQYAPPAYFPGSASFPTAPVSEDAVQLATAEVFEPYGGAGLGRVLMQVMVKDLIKRGDFRAVECFGARRPASDGSILPTEFLQRVGFKTHRPHPQHPRMRMELKSVLTWREEMESALARLLGAVRAGRPAPAAQRGAHREGDPVTRRRAPAP
jgi:GNAT superfamily N-acetyltransferase